MTSLHIGHTILLRNGAILLNRGTVPQHNTDKGPLHTKNMSAQGRIICHTVSLLNMHLQHCEVKEQMVPMKILNPPTYLQRKPLGKGDGWPGY